MFVILQQIQHHVNENIWVNWFCTKRDIIVMLWNLPDVRVFRRGRLLSDVTLLSSALRSTNGKGRVGVSEWDRSCNVLWSLVATATAAAAADPTRRWEPGEGDGDKTGIAGCWDGCLGWWGRVLGSLKASIFRTAWGDAAPKNLHNERQCDRRSRICD